MAETINGLYKAGPFDLLHKDIAPARLVFGKLNPVMVQGAVLAGMPISEGWSENLQEVLDTGDRIRLDPVNRTIAVLGYAGRFRNATAAERRRLTLPAAQGDPLLLALMWPATAGPS